MLSELVALIIPAAIFVSFALVLTILGLFQYRLAARLSAELRLAVALLIVGAGTLLSIALTERNLNETALTGSEVLLYEDFASGFAASRWLTLLVLGVSMVEIIRGVLKAMSRKAIDPAWPVLTGILVFYGGTLFVQSAMSEHTEFTYKALYLPIFFTAVFFQQLDDLRPVFLSAKLVMLVLLVSSLVGIFAFPDFVLHQPQPGIIPGINWRLFGITGHANALGPIALLAVLLEVYSPFRSRWLRWSYFFCAFAVLILAQSRTSWIAGALILALVLAPFLVMPNPKTALDTHRFRKAVWVLSTCILLLIAIACGLLMTGLGEYLLRKTELGTLNGRFQIWDITLQAWRENVFFGYGPGVWGMERRAQLNMFHVGHAHNQFVQTLGESGLVGLGLLLVYLVTLMAVACAKFAASKGLILSLFLLLLSRCVTEAPLRAEGVLSWATFLHILLIAVACHYLRLGTQGSANPAEKSKNAAVREASVDRQREQFHLVSGAQRKTA
jgi:exopolysaccharide production protein ExoQ